MGGGVESDYSVCPRPFLQFLQFCQFKLVRLHQLTSGYVRLHQITSVYVGGTGRGARQYSHAFPWLNIESWSDILHN